MEALDGGWLSLLCEKRMCIHRKDEVRKRKKPVNATESRHKMIFLLTQKISLALHKTIFYWISMRNAEKKPKRIWMSEFDQKLLGFQFLVPSPKSKWLCVIFLCLRFQVITSSNVGGKFLCFLNGGLNYQIEHHLFPRMHHGHYPKIAPVVKQFCAEKGIPYQHFPTVSSNAWACAKHLLEMGTQDVPKSAKHLVTS